MPVLKLVRLSCSPTMLHCRVEGEHVGVGAGGGGGN